jgi:hypothetical protein
LAQGNRVTLGNKAIINPFFSHNIITLATTPSKLDMAGKPEDNKLIFFLRNINNMLVGYKFKKCLF